MTLMKIDIIIYQDTTSIGLESLISIEVENGGSSGSQLLHHCLFAHLPVVFINVKHLASPSDWLTMRIVTALTSVGQIRCTLLTRRIVMIHKQAIDEAPTTMASLVHVVAVIAELHRQIKLLAMPNLDATLQHTIRRYDVAGAASGLVYESTRKVIPIYIVPSEFLRELINIYIL